LPALPTRPASDLVVGLPGTDLARGLKLPGAAGLVKDVRTGHPVPGTTRIVFDLHAPVVALKPHFEKGPDGTRLVVQWPGDDGGDPIARIAAAAASTPVAATVPQDTPAAPAQPSPVDPAIASAAATSRLVAATTAGARAPAPAPAPQAAPQVSGAVATGVPTRIATGVPTPITPPQQVPADAPGVVPKLPIARPGAGRPLIVAIDPGHGGQDPGA